MINPAPFVECEPIENVIVLVKESDFLALANKPENRAQRFVNHEYHPFDPKKVIAHHYYVLDAHSYFVFGFIGLEVSPAEYARI